MSDLSGDSGCVPAGDYPVSERLIAETPHPYPEDLVIATKGGLVRAGPGLWEPDGHPERLRRACEGSLARLRLNRIDLYQAMEHLREREMLVFLPWAPIVDADAS